MTDQEASLQELLGDVELLRSRVRNQRHGFWFALIIFGVLTLGSLGFYWQRLGGAISLLNCPGLGQRTVHCIATIAGTSQRVKVVSTCVKVAKSCSSFVYTVSGHSTTSAGWLNPGFNLNNSGEWLSWYWTAALVVGFTAVFAFYRIRGTRLGLRLSTWPAVATGLGALAVAITVNIGLQPTYAPWLSTGNLWFRGTAPILIVALGILVLAILERSAAYVAYALGFVAVALVAALYDVVNLFNWLGIGAPFQSGAQEFPNLLLPAAYLLLGGFVVWAVQHDTVSNLSSDNEVR